ncbi:MAG: hypothetical protein LUQ65_03295 [Candidatus Helarchaeota archaeon]|nr:hypothetical protein [Candidatus Helarchaeota archaeon]
MEQFSRELYNLNEWMMMRFFRVISGFKLAFNPDLKKVYLISIGDVEAEKLEIAQDQMAAEFGIQSEILNEKIEYQKAVSGDFLNTAYMSHKLNKSIKREKTEALMGVTNYWLVPNQFLLSRIVHLFNPILGITYLVPGICFLTTLDGYLRKDLVEFAAKHEAGHLLGMHGYPLMWLQKKKEPTSGEKN